MRIDADRDLQSKEFRLKDFTKSRFAETSTTITSNDELLQEESVFPLKHSHTINPACSVLLLLLFLLLGKRILI